jgi:hypothetical protein
VAFDFGSFETIPGGEFSSYDANTYPLLQNNRTARASTYLPTFMPTGTVERLHLVYTPQPRTWSWRYGTGGGGYDVNSLTTQEPTLTGGFEVTCGVPTWTGDQTMLQVPVRLAFQPTPGSGHAGTWYGAGYNLSLEVSGAFNQTYSATANANGIATFNVSVGTIQCGVLNLRAYYDPRTPTGPGGQFSEYQVAYATATVPLCPTVWLEAQPDVANDKSLHRGRLRFRRAPGRSGTLSALTVGFRLPLPGLTPDYRARYTTDYTLVAINGTTLSLNPDRHTGLHTITFAPNSSVAEIDVVPVYDDLTEDELVWAVLEPGGANYAIGPRSEAQVYIYDGPLWTLRELNDPNAYTGDRWVHAVNNDLSGTGANAAKIAGATIQHYQGSFGLNGLAWRATAYYDTPLWRYSGLGLIPFDLSDSISGSARFAGGTLQANGTYRAGRSIETSWANLPLAAGWLLTNSLARGVSPDGNWYAGYATVQSTSGSTTTKEIRATAWSATTNFAFTDLIGGATANDTFTARAYAVNNFGEFVGSLTKEIELPPENESDPPIIVYRQRGFRTRPGVAPVTDSDHLPPLGGENSVLATEALAIRKANSGTVGGLAVGWSDIILNGQVRRVSAYWKYRAISSANEIPIRVGAKISLNGVNNATAVNDFDDVVGWMKSINGPPVAYYRDRNDTVYDLNDYTVLHRLAGGENVSLETPTDISNFGHITVNGSVNSVPKSFILIRR